MSKQDKIPKETKELIKSPPDIPCDIVDINRDKIDITKALSLRFDNGLTYEQIGKMFECSKQAVHKALKPYINTEIDSGAVANNLNGILKAKQAEMLCGLTTDSIKEMSGLQMTTAFGILYDKTRLEEGKSTANVEYLSIHTSLEELQAREQAVQDELDSM